MSSRPQQLAFPKGLSKLGEHSCVNPATLFTSSSVKDEQGIYQGNWQKAILSSESYSFKKVTCQQTYKEAIYDNFLANIKLQDGTKENH